MSQPIYILSLPVHSGKTTLLMQWVKQHPGKIGGILAPDVDERRRIYDISRDAYHEFQVGSEEHGELVEICKYRFLKSGFDLSIDILKRSLEENNEWVIVDEVGKLELQQDTGLEPELKHIIEYHKQNNTNKKLMLVVRDYLLNDAILKYDLTDHVTLYKEFFS
jgi:nucleoside-triphosphatase THEP1